MRRLGISLRRTAGRAALGVAVVALASAGGAAAAQANKFLPLPGSPYPTGNEPYSVYPTNLNGDLLADLASVNGSSADINVFARQSSGGGFAAVAGSPFAVGGGPSLAAVQDFNNDGRQDIAVAQFTGQSVTIMLGQPSGALTAEGAAIPVGDQAGAIGGGDFNADGKPDFAVTNWNGGSVKIFLRKPDNTGFVAGASIATGGTNPRYIAVGDLDGANGPDLAVANIGSGKVSVLLNQPGGGLAQASGSPYTVGGQPQTLAIARLNGDDRPDIAVANYGTDNVTILNRQPGGGFQEASGSPVGVGDAPVGIAAADFRGSGQVDLAVADSGSNAVAILQNDGAGSFTRAEDVPVPPAPASIPWGIATGQFNDDTLPDIAVTNIGGTGGVGDPDSLNVFINQPPPQAATLDATDVGGASATLNATVNPRGSDTDAHFEYGTSQAYGSVAPAGGEIPAGADRTDHAISRAIDGLAPGTTYHFRIVTSNAGGTSTGDDRTFTTSATPPPPSTLSGPPQAFLSAPGEVAAGTSTTLSAEGSTPAGGLTYQLDLDGSGAFATDLKTARSLETTFTTPGDIKVGLRVTDSIGRTDTVRRTVHVTAAPAYALSYTPSNPDPGDEVRFTIRQLVDDTTKPGGARLTALPRGTLSTMTYGDGSRLSGTAGALLIPGRDASASGSFSHTFDRQGGFKLHLAIDDLNGFAQGVDLVLPVGRKGGYSPAITTSTTTVEQGSCVGFTNATFSQLPVDHKGPVQDEDINPVHKIIIVAPPTKVTPFGGQPKFNTQALNIDALTSGTVLAGSPFAHLQYTSVADLQLNFRGSARRRQAEPTQTTNGTAACEQQANLESAVANAAASKPPYPAGAGAGWPEIPKCPNAPLTTYSTDRQIIDPTLAHLQTTRHTWFSLNRWDFGDGTKSGPREYLPSYQVFHPYNKGGNFTVKLNTTFPSNLGGQLDAWKASCGSNPLDPTKNDSRFDTRSAELKLHVRAHYDRIKSRGLWMTSGAKTFDETDIPGVYSSSGPIYVNTRRIGYGFDTATQMYTEKNDVSEADGVLVVTPDNGPLLVQPDRGEIIGAARLAWQSGGQQVALGPMPLNVRGTPGLIIPEAGSGGTHDLGVFADPPAVLGSGSPPPRGAPFHVNSAHVVLREAGGGQLQLNVHLPPPLGPNGGGSDETLIRDVRGNNRVVAGSRARRGILDNVDVDIPAVELVPDAISFNGGKLSHHVDQNPPWQATGSLTVFTKKVDMSPNSKKEGCPVSGGLGFYEDGGLANAGAVLDGLEIPLPNPPAPNPISALANPAFEILPGTSSRPLDLFGCLSIHDYPDGNAFTVTGCAGFLSGGSGVSVPNNEAIPFCPDQKGSENFALTEHNSVPDPARTGRRILRGIVVRVSGTVGLGPKQYPVARAYIEYRNAPSAVEAQGHFGEDFLDDHVHIGADIFGYFRTKSDWAIGGMGGVTQDLICIPNPIPDSDDLCPDASVSALVSAKGIGACLTIYSIGIGGEVLFADRSIHGRFPGCDLEDLKRDLGVSIRRLPRYDDLLYRPRDPLLTIGAAQAGGISLAGKTPYSLIVVNGTDKSPVVEVRDPSGKLVLNDTGAAVQGLKKPEPPPAPVDLDSQTPALPDAKSEKAPQGILHNDGSQYHDANVDLRHATMILIRAPEKGKYTITAKDGSSPITAISHSDALAAPQVDAGVLKKGQQRALSLQSKLAAGSQMTIAEESQNLSHKIASFAAARSASADVTAARVNKRVPFRPALGPGGKRKLVATISRHGIPQQRMVIGSYRAPAAPKAGRVRKLRAKLRGTKLTVTWRRAKNVKHYVVSVKLRKGVTITRTVGAKAHRLVLHEALARRGATVTVRPVGPLSVSGKAARKRLAPVKVKRVKHFVL